MSHRYLYNMNAASLSRSRVHETFSAVEGLQAAGHHILSLHIAEPHPGPAEEIVEAIRRAAREPMVYTTVHGLPQLSEALIEKLRVRNAIRTSPEHIFVCPGVTQGMLALEQMLVRPGAVMLLPGVHWPLHLQQCLLAGFRPAFYPLRRDFSLDLDALEATAPAETRLILINTPANPSGRVYDRQTLERLLELARARDWLILSDEAYEDFVYEGTHVSIAALEGDTPPEKRRVFTAFTFSKSHGLGTCRIGYLVAPNAAAADAFRLVQETSIMAPSTLMQHAALAALAHPGAVVRTRERLRQTRDAILPALVSEGLLRCLPQGGWYTLLDFESFAAPAEDVARLLLEKHHTAVVPGSGFALRPGGAADGCSVDSPADESARYLARMAFSGSAADIREGLARLRSLLRSWHDRGGGRT